MTEEEKNRIYLNVREVLLASCRRQLKALKGYVLTTDGMIVGSVISALAIGILKLDINYAVPSLIGGLSLIPNILSRLSIKQINNKANAEAKKVADHISDTSNMINEALPMLFGDGVGFVAQSPEGPFVGMCFFPVGLGVLVGPQESSMLEVGYEVLSDDEISLVERCELLIEYAESVQYPSYEEDIDCLRNLIAILGNAEYARNYTMEYAAIIKDLERTMLENAIAYYNGDFAR